MFGAGDDAGGSIGGVVGSACVHQWYVSRGGAGTTCGTSRETSLTVEEKKGSLKECNISRDQILLKLREASITLLEAGVT